MATSINSYSVSLGMDAKGYVDGARLSRSETRALIKDIDGARTPTENFAREQDRLTAALDKGAISSEVYQRLLEKKRTSLLGVTDAVKSQTNVWTELSSKVVLAEKAFHLLESAASAVFAEMNRIDRINDQAHKLGMSFRDLNTIQLALGESAGVAADDIAKSMQKLSIGVTEAMTTGQGAHFEALRTLRIDPKQLGGQDAVQQLTTIIDAMQGIESQSERLKLSFDLFGKSGAALVAGFDEGSDKLREMADFADKVGVNLSGQVVEGINNANDALGRLRLSTDGWLAQLTGGIAPAIGVIADQLSGASGKGLSTLGENIGRSATNMLGTGMDIVEFLSVAMDINATQEDIRRANLWDNYNRLQVEIDIAKARAEESAETREEQRKATTERASLEENAIESAAKKQKERDEDRAKRDADRVARDNIARADATQKMIDDDAEFYAKKERHEMELALKAANRHFEEEKKKTEKGRKEFESKGASSIEVGSAESVKFMADQWKASMGASLFPNVPTPGEKELIEEARKQLDSMKKQEAIDEKILAELKNNGFKRIR